VNRSSLFRYPPGVELRTCSAEDLVVMKAFAGREKDWVDVSGILARQGSKLDWPYIRRELTPLVALKGTPENLDELERRRAQER